MLTVGMGIIIIGILVFLVVAGAGVWALRYQSRQFPKGWDRTGWTPGRDAAGWFVKKFTWLSGGRG